MNAFFTTFLGAGLFAALFVFGRFAFSLLRTEYGKVQDGRAPFALDSMHRDLSEWVDKARESEHDLGSDRLKARKAMRVVAWIAVSVLIVAALLASALIPLWLIVSWAGAATFGSGTFGGLIGIAVVGAVFFIIRTIAFANLSEKDLARNSRAKLNWQAGLITAWLTGLVLTISVHFLLFMLYMVATIIIGVNFLDD